jgi:hypothetical protein
MRLCVDYAGRRAAHTPAVPSVSALHLAEAVVDRRSYCMGLSTRTI